jgi:hypothetical protein
MSATKSAAAAATATDYNVPQRSLLGLWLFDMWDCAGFSSMYDGEERRYMPRLLVGSCVAKLKQRPLTMTDAFIVMDAKHGKTAAKYVKKAEEQDLIERVRDSSGDKRKTLLMPTKLLLHKFGEEMARVADDARDLIDALVYENPSLPDTGAAEIQIRRKRNANRHIQRANANSPFPSRNWSGRPLGLVNGWVTTDGTNGK